MSDVTVVDHGLCNLFNLTCALEEAGARVHATRNAADIACAQRLILPGVGAFAPAMRLLTDLRLVEPIRSFAATRRPLLGICLGMQLLMDESSEGGLHKGLGLLPGWSQRFDAGAGDKVPQIAWNVLHHNPSLPDARNVPLLAGIPESASMYFVHSYFVTTTAPEDTVACADYAGVRYSALVRRGSVWGAQFHPERSALAGLRLLANFAAMPPQ